MKLLFDTSVWVEHLRQGALDEAFGKVRGRFVLSFDAVVAAELQAGCRTRQERTVVARLLRPFVRSERLLCPRASDFDRAATALSRLRERGRPPTGSRLALLDALIAAVAAREGALLVTIKLRDFERLSSVMPLRVEGFESFQARLAD